MGMNHCRACERIFGTLKSFETHRTGSYGEPIYQQSRTGTSRYVIGHTQPTRRCLTEAQLQTLSMTQDAKGWWQLTEPGTTTKVEAGEEATPEEPVGHGDLAPRSRLLPNRKEVQRPIPFGQSYPSSLERLE